MSKTGCSVGKPEHEEDEVGERITTDFPEITDHVGELSRLGGANQ